MTTLASPFGTPLSHYLEEDDAELTDIVQPPESWVIVKTHEIGMFGARSAGPGFLCEQVEVAS